MQNLKIGFIGGGNIATAMISAITSSKPAIASEIFVYDRSKNESLKFKFGITPLASEKEVAQKSDIIVVAVKPSGYESVLAAVKPALKKQIVVTVAPGFSIESAQKILGGDKKIVRTMPNTPASIGEGVTAACFSQNISDDEKQNVLKMLGTFGATHEIEERLFSVFTGIAGSLPAYVFMFIEALADAAVLGGMPRAKAYEIAAASVAGSANMALKSGKHPAALKDEVCSPAGTTIEGLAALEKGGFRGVVMEGIATCIAKAKG